MPEISTELREFLGDGLSEDGLSFTAKFGKEVTNAGERITTITVSEPTVGNMEEADKIDNGAEKSRKLLSICSNPAVSPEAVRQLPISEFRKVDAFLSLFILAGPRTGLSS